MDIGPPAIELYTRLSALPAEDPSTGPIVGLSKAIVHQWGRAYANLSKKRREKIVELAHPT